MDRTSTKWDRMVREALKCKGVVALDCGLSGTHGKKQQFRQVPLLASYLEVYMLAGAAAEGPVNCLIHCVCRTPVLVPWMSLTAIPHGSYPLLAPGLIRIKWLHPGNLNAS